MLDTKFWAYAAAATPIVLVGGSLCYTVGRILWQSWLYRSIPGPPPHLLLGNVPALIRAGGGYKAWPMWHKQYGPVIKVFIMSKMLVMVADPDLGRSVLFKFTNHAPFIASSQSLMENQLQQLQLLGLFQSRDSLWRTLRNAWQPAFAPGTLERYKVLMASCADQLCGLLAGRGSSAAPAPAGDIAPVNGTDIGGETDGYEDIHEVLNQMTLEVVGTCAYGVRFHALPGKGDDVAGSNAHRHVGPALSTACKDFFGTTAATTATKWARPAAVLPHLTPILAVLANTFPDVTFTKQLQSNRTILKVSDELISDWKSKANGHPGFTTNPDAVSKSPAGKLSGVEPGSFLGLLLDAQHKAARNPGAEKLDDLTLTAQAMQFILAGTETTANTLAFAVYLLSTNPDKEARLIQELDAHGGSTPITADDKFPYVDAVVHEALRLFPPAPGTTRLITNTPKGGFKLGEHTLYDDTSVFVSGIAMHRDPAYWSRPDDFLPERWLPEGQAELGPRHPNCYIPFGAGTRQCPGYKFAQQEARIALVALYRSFTFQLQPGQVPLQCMSGLTLSPKGGIFVKPVRRRRVIAEA